MADNPKYTSLRETTSFDILIVKIRAGVFTIGGRTNQRKTSKRHLMRIFAYLGGERG